MIKEIEFESITDLSEKLNALPNHFAFRGQSNADWSIQSTLERVIGSRWTEEAVKRFEDFSINQFKSKYHIYRGNEHIPDTKLSWLCAMQHYGIPTRLIDFTTSPWIALYFALETYEPSSKKDFSIFALDYTSIMEASINEIKNDKDSFNESRNSIETKRDSVFEEILDKCSPNVAWITEPMLLNARIDRQAGTFLVSGDLSKKIDSVLNLPIYDSVQMIKYRVPAKLYEGAFVALRKMSINSKCMYGDLSGLAKSIKMELIAYHV